MPGFLEVTAKGKPLNAVKESQKIADYGHPVLCLPMEFMRFQVLGQVVDLEEGLKHPRGRPGCRHKLEEAPLLCSLSVTFEERFQILQLPVDVSRRPRYTVAAGR